MSRSSVTTRRFRWRIAHTFDRSSPIPTRRSSWRALSESPPQVNSRTAPIYRILVSAASSDPDAAALLDELTRQRQQGQGLIARSLARAGALRPELRQRDAADIIHALMSPEVYGLLVIDRGWPSERYERWLTEILIDQLLADDLSAAHVRKST